MNSTGVHVRDNLQTMQREWYIAGSLVMYLWSSSMPCPLLPLEPKFGTYPDN